MAFPASSSHFGAEPEEIVDVSLNLLVVLEPKLLNCRANNPSTAGLELVALVVAYLWVSQRPARGELAGFSSLGDHDPARGLVTPRAPTESGLQLGVL